MLLPRPLPLLALAGAAAATLTDCLTAAQVPIKLASSADWTTYEATYNTRLQYVPAAIVLPTTPQQVAASVTCAAQNNVKVQAKSGGHSYASFSTGGADGALVVDLEGFQNVTVDAGGVATVGAGIRLGNLATAIYDQGGRALPHGTCPGVGIGGHFTHGGFGFSSRAWGLSLDTIVGLDVVLANGTVVHATATAYPDVYWAVRGAADSFGIVVAFYLQTQPAPSSVIFYSYTWNGLFADISTVSKAFAQIQDVVQNASVVDRNLGLGISTNGVAFTVEGTYLGPADTFNNVIAPALLAGLPAPATTTVQTEGWLDSLSTLGGLGTLSEPATGYSAHDNFYASSLTSPAPLTADALASYFAYMTTAAPTSWFAGIDLYGGADSQINVKDNTFAAYEARDSLWTMQHYAYVPVGSAFPPSGIPFIAGMNTALTGKMPSVAFGAYMNYVDPALSADQAHALYYGSEVYDRLAGLKAQVDPQNVFANPQSVVAGTSGEFWAESVWETVADGMQSILMEGRAGARARRGRAASRPSQQQRRRYRIRQPRLGRRLGLLSRFCWRFCLARCSAWGVVGRRDDDPLDFWHEVNSAGTQKSIRSYPYDIKGT
jgi:FAD/FMN-containing dehydrogenase